MMNMREKKNKELEFVEILKKFKIQFILMEKMKDNINEKKEKELVKLLFKNMEIIVDE